MKTANQQRFKYFHTPHLPWSENRSSDDTFVVDCDHFLDKQIVITEKLDGENTTLYSDGYNHARSMDSKHHISRSWIKATHALMQNKIPAGWRVNGENLWAKHSIFYDDLPSYFLVFSVWDEKNSCLSWDDTVKFCQELEIETVPVLREGLWREETKYVKFAPKFGLETEGYVVRLREGFKFEDAHKSIAKYVRKNHIQTDEHWMHSKIEQNKLRK